MSIRQILPAYRLFFAILVFVAIVAQIDYGIRNLVTFSPANFFSFFTIESNLLTLLVFVLAATTPRNRLLDYVRGAATLYMVATGIMYSLLLAGADVQTPIAWVNAVLHYIFPLAVLLDWLVDQPARLNRKKALLWLTFPVAYLAYTLIRGAAVHWYPYPFLNVSLHGYLVVAINSAVIAAAFVALTLALASTPHLSKR